MANAWQQMDIIASEALMQLQDSLVISQLTARDKTSDFNSRPNGYAKGQSIDIKTRPDFEAKDFTGTIEVQDINESKRSMTIEKYFDVSVNVTAREKRLDMDGFTEQVIAPAMIRLAEKCDRYVGTKILQGAGLYTSDDLFANRADMAAARKEANLQQLDPASRFCLVNDDLEAKLLGLDYFTQYDNRGDEAVTSFREASLGRAMSMNFFSSLNLPEDTLAAAGNGTTQTDNTVATNNVIGLRTLTVDALTGQLEAFTRIQVAGMRRPLIVASQVLAGATSIPLVDPISELVPDNAAITVIGSGQTNLDFKGAIFDGQSVAIAMPILDKPSDKPSSIISDNGYSIRVTQGYDMSTKSETMSLDCLIGAAAWDPRRITLLREF